MKLLKIAGWAGAMLLLAASPALASSSEVDVVTTCKYRSERVQYKLDRVIAKYGADSGHAAKVRAKFADVHEWCWRRYKGWWDETSKAWRTDHW